MRSWAPIPALCLDDKGLRGEHNELHGIYSVIKNQLQGYSRHPEVTRWRGHLAALARRHDEIAAEMVARGGNHKSPITNAPADIDETPETLESIDVMRQKLAAKIRKRTPISSRNHELQNSQHRRRQTP